VWKRFVRHRDYGFDGAPVGETASVARFLAALGPNLPQRYGIAEAGGYEPVRRRDVNALLPLLKREANALAGTNADTAQAIRVRHLQAAGVGAILRFRLEAGSSADGLDRAPGAASVRAVPAAVSGALPFAGERAVLWTRWKTAASPKMAREHFLSPAWDGLPVVAGAAVAPGGSTKAPPALTCAVADPSPDLVTITLPPNHSGGLLVLADTYAPGWSARIENASNASHGGDAPILSINGLFRGVRVGPASRRVVFRYRPPVFAVGLFGSCLAAGIMGGMVGAQAAHRRFGSRAAARTRDEISGGPNVVRPGSGATTEQWQTSR
jgi:hypothetical protein